MIIQRPNCKIKISWNIVLHPIRLCFFWGGGIRVELNFIRRRGAIEFFFFPFSFFREKWKKDDDDCWMAIRGALRSAEGSILHGSFRLAYTCTNRVAKDLYGTQGPAVRQSNFYRSKVRFRSWVCVPICGPCMPSPSFANVPVSHWVYSQFCYRAAFP